jgi:ribosome-binding protein aMBF1 (putative translation factor)
MALGNVAQKRPNYRSSKPGTRSSMGSVRRRKPPKGNSPVPDGLRKIFGRNVRAARIKAGLTQAQLAERTGLTQQ